MGSRPRLGTIAVVALALLGAEGAAEAVPAPVSGQLQITRNGQPVGTADLDGFVDVGFAPDFSLQLGSSQIDLGSLLVVGCDPYLADLCFEGLSDVSATLAGPASVPTSTLFGWDLSGLSLRLDGGTMSAWDTDYLDFFFHDFALDPVVLGLGPVSYEPDVSAFLDYLSSGGPFPPLVIPVDSQVAVPDFGSFVFQGALVIPEPPGGALLVVGYLAAAFGRRRRG